MKIRIACAIAGLTASLSSHGVALAGDGSDGALGRWIMANGKITVEVEDCGGNLCGRIVDMAEPLTKDGTPKVDRRNPDPQRRSVPLIGLTVLKDMSPDGKDKWQGRIYNADDGRTYASKMKLAGDKMKVKGCVLVFCKSMTFTRVN